VNADPIDRGRDRHSPALPARIAGALVLLALAAAACSDDEPGHAPGGLGGSSSTTTTTTTTTTGAGGATATSTSTGPSDPGLLGAPCEADDACDPDGECLRQDGDEPLLGGGPVRGYCTRACTSDEDCPGGACLGAPSGKCLLGCTPGPAVGALTDPLDPAKCRGRDDLACASDVTAAPVCVPACGKDAQCPGRLCSPRFGVCVDQLPTGKPFGQTCTPADDACTGVCEPVSDTAAMCSARCVVGHETVASNDCGGLFVGLCFPRDEGDGAGDRGACTPACTEHDDCVTPALWCTSVDGITGDLVPLGYCRPAEPCEPGGPCVEGTCTATAHGDFCLDPSYPLGLASP
jgi:hypothetical protein